MAASLTRYCLDELSDYEEFERLCHELLILEGFPMLEPLGGSQDKGRDAIHNCMATGTTTVFAYSVREDWQVKLAQDAKKVYQHGHNCNVLFFLTTAKVTATQRDLAVEKIQNQYGWKLEIKSMEWFSAILDAKHSHLKTKHPSIFPPEILELDHKSKEKAKIKYIYISFSSIHRVLAEWIARKLAIEGYNICSPQLSLPENISSFNDSDQVIREESCCFVSLFSEFADTEAELILQRSLALSISKQKNIDFLIPLCTDRNNLKLAATLTSPIKPILFENWSQGWQELIRRVEKLQCQCGLPSGVVSASRVNFSNDVFLNVEESALVISNCLKITKIPQIIYRFKLSAPIKDSVLSAYKYQWAFRLDNKEILSFHSPPNEIKQLLAIRAIKRIKWEKNSNINGTRSIYIVSELLRKAIIVKCHQKGLEYCSSSNLHYFPRNLVNRDKLHFVRPNASKSRIQCCGKRSYYKPTGSEEYCYFLAPCFQIRQDLFDQFSLVLTIRYRFTDIKGNPLVGKKVNSRRKHLCKSWWNNAWLDRTLAVFQFLADDYGLISIGELPKETISTQAEPLIFHSAVSVNESFLAESRKSRKEMLDALHNDEKEEV